jgi:hypothetical protein
VYDFLVQERREGSCLIPMGIRQDPSLPDPSCSSERRTRREGVPAWRREGFARAENVGEEPSHWVFPGGWHRWGRVGDGTICPGCSAVLRNSRSVRRRAGGSGDATAEAQGACPGGGERTRGRHGGETWCGVATDVVEGIRGDMTAVELIEGGEPSGGYCRHRGGALRGGAAGAGRAKIGLERVIRYPDGNKE